MFVEHLLHIYLFICCRYIIHMLNVCNLITNPVREVCGANILHGAGEDAVSTPLNSHSAANPEVVAHDAHNGLQPHEHAVLVFACEIANPLRKRSIS